MADPSRPPTFKQYNVKPYCHGCGRKLIAKHERSLWFTSIPRHAVYGQCCYRTATQTTEP